jgi:hypothetical protein
MLVSILTQIFAETRQNVWKADPSYEFMLDGQVVYQKTIKSEPRNKKLKPNSENMNPLSPVVNASPSSPFTQLPSAQLNQNQSLLMPANNHQGFNFNNQHHQQSIGNSQYHYLASQHQQQSQPQIQSFNVSSCYSPHSTNQHLNNFITNNNNVGYNLVGSRNEKNTLGDISNVLTQTNDILSVSDEDTQECPYKV